MIQTYSELYFERQKAYIAWREVVDREIEKLLDKDPSMEFARAQYLGHIYAGRKHTKLRDDLMDLDNRLYLFDREEYDRRQRTLVDNSTALADAAIGS